MSRPARATVPAAPLSTRVTPDERERIERAARENHQSLSQFCRHRILAKAESVLLSISLSSALRLVSGRDDAAKAESDLALQVRDLARQSREAERLAGIARRAAALAVAVAIRREERRAILRAAGMPENGVRGAVRAARMALAFKEDVDWREVFKRSDGTCGICGGELSRTSFSIDHIVPIARGGDHSYANVQAAHKKCNSRKGARWIGGFKTRTPCPVIV